MSDYQSEIRNMRQRVDKIETVLQDKIDIQDQSYDLNSNCIGQASHNNNSNHNNSSNTNNYLKKQKKARRCATEIDKNFDCPYGDCKKTYGSEVSLNLHIKLKHNGGNKTEREKLARTLFLAQMNGENMPELDLNLPPGFIEKYKENIKKIQIQSDENGNQLDTQLLAQKYFNESMFGPNHKITISDQQNLNKSQLGLQNDLQQSYNEEDEDQEEEEDQITDQQQQQNQSNNQEKQLQNTMETYSQITENQQLEKSKVDSSNSKQHDNSTVVIENNNLVESQKNE